MTQYQLFSASFLITNRQQMIDHRARLEVDLHPVFSLLSCQLSNHWLSSKCTLQQLLCNKGWNPFGHFSFRVSSVPRTWEGHCRRKGPFCDIWLQLEPCGVGVRTWDRVMPESYTYPEPRPPCSFHLA